ncbi:hypothetical protein GWP40_08710 [Treponema vincentii]|uniref:apolipoprotein A1/A4/E family protein n=1 Tax=Treponema vincentii TaxID=69710 RepID=UPI001BAFD5A0|nr:apolipoprotein A1/A4/E family protein [Treponema vincentii]QUY18388.1 hypothetical protein GWP40_08710 [Treponema vincentii]
MAYTNEQLGKALEDLTIAYNNFIEKAKDAAIAAMGDTVIAQIKQDAKEYIASELAAQKAALEQAIEEAKIALKNSVVDAGNKLEQQASEKKNELNALIVSAENALTQLTAENLEKLNAAKERAEAAYKALADEENGKLKNVALQAKEDVIEILNTLSEKTGLQIEEAEKTFEKKLEAEVHSFKAAAKQEAARLRNITQSQLQEFAYGYKDLYNNVLFFMNKPNSSSILPSKPLQGIEKIKLPKKDGILMLLCYSGYYYGDQYVLRASICNTNKKPVTVLGYSKFFDVENAALIFYNQALPRYDCFNVEKIKPLVFNFYAKDLMPDEDGFSYIAFEGMYPANYGIAIYGYCTAEVNTNFMLADLHSMSEGYYKSNLYYYSQHYFLNNNSKYETEIGLPYREVQKNIIIGLLFSRADKNCLRVLHIRGYATNITYSEVEKPVCNSFKLFKPLEPLLKDFSFKFFKIPAQEVIANTELIGSIKVVRLVLWKSYDYSYSNYPIQALFVDDEQVPVDNLDTLLPPSFKTMQIALDAGADDSSCYKIIPIKPFLAEEKRYIFEADFKVLSGNPAAVTVLFYDFTTKKILVESQTPVINGQCRIKFEFVFTYTVGHDTRFLCYSGENGKTNGVRCEYSNFALIEKGL